MVEDLKTDGKLEKERTDVQMQSEELQEECTSPTASEHPLFRRKKKTLWTLNGILD
jgi:hypothetical protein